MKIEWSHIRWEQGTVKIMGTKNKQAEAVVAITGAALPELLKWHEKCGKPASGPVFVYKGSPIKNWKEALRGCVERAGLDPDGTRKITPYSARYTYAPLGILAGVNDAAMRRGMRHAYASRVMETTYQRLSEAQLCASMSAFPSFGK